MATEGLRYSQQSALEKGAQCPNCFTFNLLHHLPESRKRRSRLGLEITCALCGTRYAAERLAPVRPGLSGHEKGAA